MGLQNKGVNYFVEQIYPRIKDIETNMIVNVSGSAIEDYVKTAEAINELDKIPAIELNISCLLYTSKIQEKLGKKQIEEKTEKV